MKRYLLQGLLILAAFLLRAEPVHAQQQPCQWQYAIDGFGTSYAQYCSNVTVINNLTVDGTITAAGFNFPNEAANTVLAGPTSGSPANPTFRALVAGDIPSLSYLPLSGGTVAGNVVVTGSLTGVTFYQLSSGSNGVWNGAGIDVPNTAGLKFSSTSNASGTIDTTVCRASAGVIEIGSSTGCAASGTINASGYQANGTAGVTSTTCTQYTDGICTHS